MKTITFKELYQLVSSPFILPESIPDYPDIDGNTSNFITDYNTNKTKYDRYFLKHYGQMSIDLESSDPEDLAAEFKDECLGVLYVYLTNWARLYYALSLDYNPLYNVDGTETTVYGTHVETFAEGQREHTEGAKSRTNGAQTNTSTEYAVAFDSALEKETGKAEDSVGAQTNTEATYTNTDTHALDTSTSQTHTDTLTRQGNIGVTKSTDLLRDEVKLRREFAFYDNLFKVFVEELGAYWEE